MSEKENNKKNVAKEVIVGEIKKDPTAKTIEVVWRDGKALDIVPEIKDVDVSLSGTIGAPAEYAAKREGQFDKERSNVKFSKNPENLQIVLETNEHKEKPRYKVIGKLDQSEELKLFGIAYKSSQQPKTYTVKELGQLLRFNKRLFAKVDECTAVVEGLVKFRIKVDADITKIKEQGGSHQESYNIKVSHDIPMRFTVEMPLYKGKPAKKFDVDICFDVRSAKDIVLWLESMDLATFIQQDADQFIDEELKKLDKIVQIEI